MKSRLPVVFSAQFHIRSLCATINTFIDLNAGSLGKFKLIIYLTRPDADTVELIKSLYLDRTPYLMAGPKPPCVPCILKRHKVRYGVVIPPGYISVLPLCNYIDEIRHTLSTIPELTHIRLDPNTDLTNKITNRPIVYHYYTRNILVGNGNFSTDYPVLLKTNGAHSATSTCGMLRKVVFTKKELDYR